MVQRHYLVEGREGVLGGWDREDSARMHANAASRRSEHWTGERVVVRDTWRRVQVAEYRNGREIGGGKK